jgi:cytochrome c oxidase assembly protein Cox11
MAWKYYATMIYVVTSIMVCLSFAAVVVYNVACVKSGQEAFEMVERHDEEEAERMIEEVVVSLE